MCVTAVTEPLESSDFLPTVGGDLLSAGEGVRGHILLIAFSYSLSNRCHFRASNFLIKSTIKKDIFLEGKLHIPPLAQFGIKNAAIAVQLAEIFVQFRE